MIDHEQHDDDHGQLLDPHHRRSDARMVAQMISLGVVSEERAAGLLRAGIEFAEKAVIEDDERRYIAAMKIPLAVARLELERVKMDRNVAGPVDNNYSQVNIYLPDNGRYSPPDETPRTITPT